MQSDQTQFQTNQSQMRTNAGGTQFCVAKRNASSSSSGVRFCSAFCFKTGAVAALVALAGMVPCGLLIAQPIPEAPTGAMPTPMPPSGAPMPITPAPDKVDQSPGSPGAAAAEQERARAVEAAKAQEQDGKDDLKVVNPGDAKAGEGRRRVNPGRVGDQPGMSPKGSPDKGGQALPRGKSPMDVIQKGANPNTGAKAVANDTGVSGANSDAQVSRALAAGMGDDEKINLAAFSEPINLKTLVSMVAEFLNINITTIGELPGSVLFNAPVEVSKQELLILLDSLLEQNGFTITQDARTGWYTVGGTGTVQVNFVGERSTTRIFATPNLRPSSLKQAIESQLGTSQNANGRQYAYIDDLGVIIATDAPRRLDSIATLITQLIQEYNRAQFIRLDVVHISAPVARDRALQLIGVIQQGVGGANNPGVAISNQGPGIVGKLDNLGDRLTIDPQGNSLIFRGVALEIERVREVLAVIDVPNTLQPKQYFAGSAAGQIANLARDRGLGEVTIFSSGGEGANAAFDPRAQQRAAQGLAPTSIASGGSVMIVDETRGQILYYATSAQHEQMARLIKELDTQSELIIIKAYKLNHQKAEDVAEIISGLINNQSLAGEAPLLPGGGGNSRNRFNNANNPSANTANSTRSLRGGQQAGAQGEEGLSLDGANSFVIPDAGNNQIIVKAPKGQQEDFRRLIETLDLRKSQVYIEARIVAVTADDSFRLAFETQLINANGTGGVLNTNFGLSSFATGGRINAAKTVATGLAGLTAAVIKSDQIPIIMTALASTTDTRIIASPQLLVDDNEESEVVSVDEQPFTSTSQTSGNPSQTSFAGFAEAGTTLNVTPQISPGGYLKLKYRVELSSFTGDPPSPGVPPPRQKNNVEGSVTIPSDFTVIVGGLILDTKRKTVVKVPFLGDIPIIGTLFQDLRDSDRKTTLYIFLTPKILKDPTFEDLLMLSRGPQWETLKQRDVPELMPSVIEVAPSPEPTNILPWGSRPVRDEDGDQAIMPRLTSPADVIPFSPNAPAGTNLMPTRSDEPSSVSVPLLAPVPMDAKPSPSAPVPQLSPVPTEPNPLAPPAEVPANQEGALQEPSVLMPPARSNR